jgi:hypothetical protein
MQFQVLVNLAPANQVDVMPTIGEEKYSEDNRLAL